VIHFSGKRVPEHPWSNSGGNAGLYGLIFDHTLQAVV
jgi:hypothetical protein